MDFNRRIIVKFFSKTDDVKTEQLTEIDSKTGIKINFDCVKNITPDPNIGVLQVTNLSQATCDMLISRGLWCEVYASYEDQNTLGHLLFAGQVNSGSAVMQGADKILKIILQTKFNALDNVYNNQFETNTNAKYIVKDILKKCKIPFSDNEIIIKGNLDWRGISFFSTFRETLNELSNWFNFTWSIQDTGFIAIDDGEIIENYTKCDSSIISVSTLTDNDDKEGAGYNINCILNSDFKIGNGVEFNSSFNPAQSVKLYKMMHHASSHADTWSTVLIGYKCGSKKIKKNQMLF